jgi:hypothetical protein
MRLEKEQRNQLLEWVAAGLETGEINKRAAEFMPPFMVSRAQVDYYRKTRGVNLQNVLDSGQYDALKTGLALKEERVKRLTLLAALMEEDLFNGVLWTEDVKMIGSGPLQERVEFEEFNGAEVQQYRGVLDDIAKEMGGRVQRQEVTGADGGPIVVVNWDENAANNQD